MISTDPSSLRANARRAYELGRLRQALYSAALVLPMIALSLLAGRNPIATALAGPVLAALALSFRWRGQAWGRAVAPGLLAGSAPLVLPLLLRSGGYCCIGQVCCPKCLIACLLGGALAGVAIGLAAAAEREQRGVFLLSASLLAGLAGTLGCAIVGVGGIAGMALAVILSSVPVAALARLRSA